MECSVDFTTGGFKRGDLILSSKPFVYVLVPQQRGKRCDHCFAAPRDKILRRCSACTFVYYCGQQCQKSSWPEHKQECIDLKRVAPNVPTSTVQLLARLIRKDPCSYNCYETVGTYKRCFLDLMTHFDDIRKDKTRNEQFHAFLPTLRLFLGKYFPSVTKVFELFCKMVINSFTISDGEMQAVGTGLYLGPSMLDHSCQPNATVVFDGTTLNVHAVNDISHRDIKQIYISYIDSLDTTAERQKQLHEQYYFKCACLRCISKPEASNLIMRASSIPQFEGVLSEARKTLNDLRILKKNGGESEKILDRSVKCLKALERTGQGETVRIKMLDYAFDACIDLKMWDQALRYGLQTLEPYKLHYGDYHPNLGIQLFKVGKILLYQGKVDAKTFLLQARDVLLVTHGSTHPLYKDLLQLIAQSHEEAMCSAVSSGIHGTC